jgi:antitoxin VapB
MDKEKVSSQSQAVSMSRKHRSGTGEVSIRREDRTVVVEPIAQDWAWLDNVVGPLDDDFVEAVL